VNTPAIEFVPVPGHAEAAEVPAVRCFHCGEEIVGEPVATVVVHDAPRPMCCNGCAAVARAISGAGLATYYRRRDAFAERADASEVDAELACYDAPEIQQTFVRACGDGLEAALIVEGIRCAACIWLTETHLAQVDGVSHVQINYATRRAVVRWDPARTRLSLILAAVQAVGYRAHPYDPGRQERLLEAERRTALRRLFVAGIGMMQVMMYAFPAYVATDGSMPWDLAQLMRLASWVLTTPVVFYAAAPFFVAAARDLRLGRVGMDVPVALGVGAAYLASVWATLARHGEVYFDSVAMFVCLLLAGRYLELLARRKALASIERLAAAQPAFADRLTDPADLARAERVPVAALRAGEFVRVVPGERLPADGVVVSGAGDVDESLLTGESRPVPKAPGGAVVGGSVNVTSPLVVRIERVGPDTALAAIVRLMDRALAARPAVAQLADRIAGRFVAALLVLSAGVGLAWWYIDPSRVLWVTLSMLVVSCPCALSLATPAALAAATGRLSRAGVLVTRGHAIETLARATHVVFDKTGTLTRGAPRLETLTVLGTPDRDRALALAAALEAGSGHALAGAIRDAAAPLAEVPTARAIDHVPGRGIEGRVDGARLRIGVPAFVAELAGPLPAAFASATPGITAIALGGDGGWLARLEFTDEIRPEASAVVRALQESGRRVSILSGDGAAAVDSVARRLGILEARHGLTPAGKLERLEALQAQGGIVAMIGDGINDAPVLGAAHVSVAVDGSSLLAQSSADVVLTSGGLTGVGFAFDMSRATLRVVRQNLAWAFAYNALAIPAAALGWVTPWMAGIGMSASSLLVVLNAVRLAGKEP
jgi:P-type Cu2+ transporter